MTRFWKMHGAGNDFILIDDRRLAFPVVPEAIAALCARHTGVGADGLLLIQPSRQADFRMRFFNPDGGEADMCGNAARCVARLALDIGAAARHMQIETCAGLLSAAVDDAAVTLGMTPPGAWRLDQTLTGPAGESIAYDFVNTGVPHAIVRVADTAACDVRTLGAAMRRHAAFAPHGANVNVVAVLGPRELSIRTYERGVEDETLACGTGIVAAAVVAVRHGWVTPPVALRVAGGDVLTVGCESSAGVIGNVTLTGPTAYVYRGECDDARPPAAGQQAQT
jgi:diaminopimelate epimerase